MGVFNDLAAGFVAMTVAMMALNTITVAIMGSAEMMILFVLILQALLFMLYVIWEKREKTDERDGRPRWKQILTGLFGVSFACWFFDVATTFYLIDVSGLAYEANPLGWPLGILGGLIFYVPAFVFTQRLMRENGQKLPVSAAVVITLLALYIAWSNLIAAGQNFGWILSSATR